MKAEDATLGKTIILTEFADSPFDRAIRITWHHRHGLQTIKGEYHPLTISHVTRCDLYYGELHFTATKSCSTKDIYNSDFAKWFSLMDCVKQAGFHGEFLGKFLLAVRAHNIRPPRKPKPHRLNNTPVALSHIVVDFTRKLVYVK